MSENSVVRERMNTPWGMAQQAWDIIPGMGGVSTASHGGVKLSRERNLQIPGMFRREGGWYEEDCEVAIPYHFFAEEIAAANPRIGEMLAQNPPRDTIKSWYWREYEAFFGVELAEGESGTKDEYLFLQRHAEDWIGVSAFGDWHEGVPKGLVGVVATKGAARHPGREERYFLVPACTYSGRGIHGFVIDLDVHQESDFLNSTAYVNGVRS